MIIATTCYLFTGVIYAYVKHQQDLQRNIINGGLNWLEFLFCSLSWPLWLVASILIRLFSLL